VSIDSPQAPSVSRAAFRGPDGMAFSDDGRLWCTVYGEWQVTVLDGAGRVVERLQTKGRLPTNVAFGPWGERRI
jgi:gluconolactonase